MLVAGSSPSGGEDVKSAGGVGTVNGMTDSAGGISMLVVSFSVIGSEIPASVSSRSSAFEGVDSEGVDNATDGVDLLVVGSSPPAGRETKGPDSTDTGG